MTEKSIISFYSEFGGNADISVQYMDGRTVIHYENLEVFKSVQVIHQGYSPCKLTKMLHIGTVISQTMNKAELGIFGYKTSLQPIKSKILCNSTGVHCRWPIIYQGLFGWFLYDCHLYWHSTKRTHDNKLQFCGNAACRWKKLSGLFKLAPQSHGWAKSEKQPNTWTVT